MILKKLPSYLGSFRLYACVSIGQWVKSIKLIIPPIIIMDKLIAFFFRESFRNVLPTMNSCTQFIQITIP